MRTQTTSNAARDFNKVTIKKLRQKGIVIYSMSLLPSKDKTDPMPYANGEMGYIVDDNGTSKVWTFPEVLENSTAIGNEK